jgi:chromosome segregation protein
MAEPSKLNFEDVLISTPIDKMIEIIRENREINLEYVAAKLNENIQKVEEWASLLEDQGMIKVDYALSKVILKWNAPTKDEKEKRTVEYKEDKGKFAASLSRIKEQVENENVELEKYSKQISDTLSKYEKVIESLKRDYDVYSGIGEGKDKRYVDLSEKIISVNSKIDQVSDHLMVIEMNMRQIKEEMSRNMLGVNIEKIRGTKENIDRMLEKMSEVQLKLAKVKEEVLGKEMEGSKISSAIESAVNFRQRQEKLEGMILKIERNFELISDANETIKFFVDHIALLEKKINSLTSEMEKPGDFKEIEARVGKVRKEKDLLREELDETKAAISTIKTSMKESIPEITDIKSIGEIKKEMESLKAGMKGMDDIQESLSKLKEVDKVIEDISQLNDRIETEKEKLAKEVGDLINLADEEVETYKTFERIRDRVVAAVNNYTSEITRLKEEYGSAKKDIDKLQIDLDKIVSSISTNAQESKNKELMEKTEKLISSFQRIKESSNLVNAMKGDMERLNKNIAILEKEYKILELRNPEEVGKKIELAETQMDDYRKKKKELSDVIKKMWEEEKEGGKKKK